MENTNQLMRVDLETKEFLDKLKTHPRQSYNEVIQDLIDDRRIEMELLESINTSYEDYVEGERDAVERGFDRHQFVMTKEQYKTYQNHFNKETGKMKDRDKFAKFWDEITEPFRHFRHKIKQEKKKS